MQIIEYLRKGWPEALEIKAGNGLSPLDIAMDRDQKDPVGKGGSERDMPCRL